MIMYGTHLTSTSEELIPVEVKGIYEMIMSPDDRVLATLTRLRTIRNMDLAKYTQMKRELPYFVCGNFSPKYRRTENFAYTEYFVVDIDHISEKGLDIQALKDTFQQDERIVMCFISPSCDGIKLLFKLEERCYDAGMYAMFYRAFVHRFSDQYHLDQVLDTKTCDVTRACFISYDPMASFRPEAEKIRLKEYLNTDNVNDVFSQDHQLLHPKDDKEKDSFITEIQLPVDPDKDTLLHIKQVLGQKRAQMIQEKPHVFVPQILDEVIDEVKQIIENTGIKVTNIQDIQYGKKIQTSLGMRMGEVNIFFGKRGFSVVQSPKRGCSAELNDVVAEILMCYFQISEA